MINLKVEGSEMSGANSFQPMLAAIEFAMSKQIQRTDGRRRMATANDGLSQLDRLFASKKICASLSRLERSGQVLGGRIVIEVRDRLPVRILHGL